MAWLPISRPAFSSLMIAALLGAGAVTGLLHTACSWSRTESFFVARYLTTHLNDATVRLPIVPLEETFDFEGDSWLFRPNGNIQLSRSSNFWNCLTFFPTAAEATPDWSRATISPMDRVVATTASLSFFARRGPPPSDIVSRSQSDQREALR